MRPDSGQATRHLSPDREEVSEALLSELRCNCLVSFIDVPSVSIAMRVPTLKTIQEEPMKLSPPRQSIWCSPLDSSLCLPLATCACHTGR